jgi:hypothetical protein
VADALHGSRVLAVERALPDGSCLSRRYAAGERPARRNPVRVVASALDDPGRPGAGPYRLITTLLDWERHPSRDLAALYAQRWEQETALDELKTHQRGAGVVLASKTRTGSASRGRRTCWSTTRCGRCCTGLRVRVGVDCDRLSFTDTLRAVRRSVTVAPGVVSPERLVTALVWLRDDLLAHLLSTRRLRGQPRVVKRKMSNFGVKHGPGLPNITGHGAVSAKLLVRALLLRSLDSVDRPLVRPFRQLPVNAIRSWILVFGGGRRPRPRPRSLIHRASAGSSCSALDGR